MCGVSTADPAIARAKRQTRRPSLARVIVLLVLLFAGGALSGYGWAGVARFEDVGEPPAGAIIGVVSGMPLAILAVIVWSWTVMKRSDIGLAYGFAAVLVGAGLGIMVAFQNSANEVASWIAWGLVVGGVLFFALGISAATARRRQTRRDRETMQAGTRTTATVTDKGYDFFRESPRILTTVTFTFTDLHGTRRWVKKTVLIEQSDPIVDGQETRLWYDAANPGDTRSIVVEAAQDRPVRR